MVSKFGEEEKVCLMGPEVHHLTLYCVLPEVGASLQTVIGLLQFSVSGSRQWITYKENVLLIIV
jgi:hypothetical protein